MAKPLILALLAMVFLGTPVQAEGNLSLTLLADQPPRQPVVGEMIAVTLRGQYDRKIANERLEIAPSDAFDWIQTRADDWSEQMIDGKTWLITERHLAIWPRRAGPVQFGGATHHLTVIGSNSQRVDVTVNAKPLTISVGEFPAQRGWKFAASAVELTEELSTDPAHLADGATVTRTIRLRALGALPEHLPPRPVVSEPWLITFAAPVERTMELTPDGPLSEVVWRWQFRPETGEPGVLEPVKIPWFNTEDHRLETVEIPAISIGYASFYTGQTPQGRFGPAAKAKLAGAGLAGLGIALLWAARSLRPVESAAVARRVIARFSLRARWRLWRAKRRRDYATALHEAARLQRPAAEQAWLTHQLYGRPDTGLPK